MRVSIVVLVAVLAVGGIVITTGLVTEPNATEITDTLTQYEKLQNYKEGLEKINQYHRDLLDEVKQKIANSNDETLLQLNQEIDAIQSIIDDNMAELDEVVQKLSEMKP